MAKIIKDEKKIEELLTRGVEEVIDKENLKKKLLSGKQLRIKLGIDPTSPNIHLGRSIPLLKLKDFQDLGHKVVFIAGDFTGIIGDTSDKDSERPMLTEKIIKQNLKNYKKQVGKIIDLKKCEFHQNSKWLKKLGYKEVGEHANIFSINQFISRENIAKRLKEGKRVSLREVLYPLMQGYDSVAIKADVELGGTDQKFNLLAGRDMQKEVGQNPQDIVMTKIIEGLDGRKMSSSWGNTINFLDEPNEMYGKIMSMSDDLIIPYFKLLTRVPMEMVAEHEKSLSLGFNPKDIKQKLAFEITKMYHDQKKAEKAEEFWQNTFSKKEIPEDLKEINAAKGSSLKIVFSLAKLLPSISEFNRRINGGAIKNMETGEVLSSDIVLEKDITLKYGKKDFVRIVVR
ncbi:MAG: tyrosyl-tRNA synthetase [Patescibacteria group bacterium]|jgi:tyrosyl-tRNA synthetase|nr:tyrosyl-tRNA synthetase [Patescibacteria group bacterium]